MDVAFLGGNCIDAHEIIGLNVAKVGWSYVEPEGTAPLFLLQTELQAVTTAISTPTLSGLTISSVSVNVMTDQLDVAILPGANSSALDALTMLVSQGLNLTVVRTGLVAADVRTDPTSRIVVGGEDITDGSTRCTSNISVKNSTEYGALTAGHCFPESDQVAQNGSASNLFDYTPAKNIGASAHSVTYQGAKLPCDCESLGPLPANRATQSTYVNGNAVYNFLYFAQSESYFDTGTPVCLSGVSEYEKYGQDICGTVTTSSYTPEITETDGYCDRTYYDTDAFQVTFPANTGAQLGDSGGVLGSGTTILGVLSGASGSGAAASKIRNISVEFPGVVPSVPGH